MLTRLRLQIAISSAAVVAVAISGCSFSKPHEHSSKEAMESATSGTVTARQAADVEIAMAVSLEQSGDLEKAEKTYREALKKDSRRADAEDRLAVLCDKKGEKKEANAHFAKAVSLDPKNPDYLADQGYCFYLQRRWSDAETKLEKAVKLDRKHVRSHNNLGLVLARQGNERGALKQFELAGLDISDAQTNLGLMLALEGRFEDARKAYEKALVKKPDSPIAKEGLRAANLALAPGRFDDSALAAVSKPTTRRDADVQRTSNTVTAK